jgi:effector-binding domain-containing protein
MVMIAAPKIVQAKGLLTAMIHLTIPKADIQKEMGPGIAEVRAAVAGQGIAVTGPWLTHHLRMDPNTWDFEICVPVASPVTPTGRVTPGKWPAGKVVRTVYHGGYEGLGQAWGELGAWIDAAGLTPAEDLWEVYLVDPGSDPEPSNWQTELNRPLRG